MKTGFAFLTVASFIFFSATGKASEFLKEYELRAVAPGSSTALLIERAYFDIFHSPVGKMFCDLYQTPSNLNHSLGISVEATQKLSQICGYSAAPDIERSKIFRRNYKVVLDSARRSDIESWTTMENETILFIDNQLNFEGLKILLLHEMAMSLDAKMNLFYAGYLKFENLLPPELANRNVVAIPLNLSAKDYELKSKFDRALYQPFAYAFATMRGFNIESLYMGNDMRTYTSHEECVTNFRRLAQFFLANPGRLKHDDSTFQGQLSMYVSNGGVPTDIERALSIITDPNPIQTTRGTVTFCQYMSLPMLVQRSLYSFFANGPRPRVTGGWGDLKVDDPSQNRNGKIFEQIKLDFLEFQPQRQDPVPSRPVENKAPSRKR